MKSQGPNEVLRQYHHGYATGDASAIRTAIGPTLFMSSGNHSDSPSDWQAHLFLSGEEIPEWIDFMLAEAGPHANEFVTIQQHERGNSALVTTRDTGSNKFRSWHNEETVWQLGRVANEWKIVGSFVRNLANPD